MNADILLLVAERVDLPTLGVLMRLNKTVNSLLHRYQTSIVKSRITTQKLGDGNLTLYTHHGRFYTRPPTFDRAYSFPMLRTMATRERVIDQLLESNWFLIHAMLVADDELNDLIVSEGYLARVADGLKHACVVTDRLSDCRMEFWIASETGVRLAPDWRRVRCAQIAVLQSLSFFELAFLTKLLQISTQNWETSHRSNGPANQRLIKDHMSHENTLRHGFLGLLSVGRMGLRDVVDFAHAETFSEFVAWYQLSWQEFEGYVSGFD